MAPGYKFTPTTDAKKVDVAGSFDLPPLDIPAAAAVVADAAKNIEAKDAVVGATQMKA